MATGTPRKVLATEQAEAAVQRVRDLYERTCKATIDGCSDDLELFLSDLCTALVDGTEDTDA